MDSCSPPLARARGWRGLLTALLVASPLLLGGCLVQSKIQGRYVEDQGGCRDSAESNITAVQQPTDTPKDRNTKLVTLFADCMAKKGWQVARPKSKPTTNGPHGPLDPYPSAVRTTTTTTTTGPAPAPGAVQQQLQPGAQPQSYQQVPVTQQRTVQSVTTTSGPAQPTAQPYGYAPPTQAPVGQRPVQTSTTPLSPSGSMPPLSAPADSGPAYYQPGRSYAVPDASPSVGGAGRNF